MRWSLKAVRMKSGPGDIQSEGRYGDFVLQLECKTNGKHLNSGVFFRCVPDQYQNGYEAQIQNGYKDDDRTKPSDFGTGAIYRRVPARKVVANDNEWFTMRCLFHHSQRIRRLHLPNEIAKVMLADTVAVAQSSK